MKGKQAGHTKTKITKYLMNIIIYKARLSKETINIYIYIYTVKYNIVSGIKKKSFGCYKYNTPQNTKPKVQSSQQIKERKKEKINK